MVSLARDREAIFVAKFQLWSRRTDLRLGLYTILALRAGSECSPSKSVMVFCPNRVKAKLTISVGERAGIGFPPFKFIERNGEGEKILPFHYLFLDLVFSGSGSAVGTGGRFSGFSCTAGG
jgi:hypothetical protein